MKNDFYLQEQIEAYLNGQLPEAERQAFGEKMQQDPLLKQEVEFQQDIIRSLQQYRKVQLKTRLQNIEVAPVNHTGFLKLKWGAIATGIVVVATSGLYFYKQATEPTIVEPVTIEAPVAEAPVPKPDTQVTLPAHTVPAPLEALSATADRSTNKATTAANSKTSKAPAPQQEANYDFDSTFEQAIHPGGGLNLSSKANETMPNGQVIAGASAAIDQKVDVKLMESKEYANHYQYYNHKLFLYGNFNNKPYELLEINNIGSRTLYMYHDSAFYLLENNSLAPRPLVKITSKELQQELKQKLQSR